MSALSVASRDFAASLGQRRAHARAGWPSYRTMVRKALEGLRRKQHDRVLTLDAGQGLSAPGAPLPHADGAFEAATLVDALARIAPGSRIALLREVARTTTGPLYLKDRVADTPLDRLRLRLLLGRSAEPPLSTEDWRLLAQASGWQITARLRGHYRHGLVAWLFPDRLEIAMRWER